MSVSNDRCWKLITYECKHSIFRQLTFPERERTTNNNFFILTPDLGSEVNARHCFQLNPVNRSLAESGFSVKGARWAQLPGLKPIVDSNRVQGPQHLALSWILNALPKTEFYESIQKMSNCSAETSLFQPY